MAYNDDTRDNFSEGADDDIVYIYSDVAKALQSGLSISSFDTETLIDVHDYAYDIHDDFVAEELMNEVLKRNPRSMAMNERKAMAYLRAGEMVGAKAVVAKLSPHSFIRRIVNAADKWDSDTWRNSYDRMFNGFKKGSIDDFGALSLIDFALDFDSLGHLAELISDIVPLMRYPEDFLFDLSSVLRDDNRFADSARVLQELTTIQSFNIDYWLLLADLCINQLEKYKEGKDALDYALAIDPKSPRALLLLGDLLVKTGASSEQIHEIADRIAVVSDFAGEAYFLKAGAYIRDDDKVNAVACLEKCLDNAANPLGHVMLIMSMITGEMSEQLTAKISNVLADADEQKLEQWIMNVSRLLPDSVYSRLIEIIRSTSRQFGSAIAQIIAYNLYMSSKYKAVDELLSGYDKAELSASSLILLLFSRIRTGNADKKDATEAIAEIIEKSLADNGLTAERQLLYLTVIRVLNLLHQLIEETEGNKLDINKLDRIDCFLAPV